VGITEQNLIIRHGQAKYNIKNHGSDLGLPSKPNAKGWNKIERTAENIKDFKDKIKDLIFRDERFEGTYRKSKLDAYSAIHFYDAATRQNAIFKQKTKN
jgi:broad specificity phosphatase PhoE